MKIAILGAGAIGSLYGGLLAEGGNEVWFLDLWKEHLEVIKKNGLIVQKYGAKRIITGIQAAVSAEEIGPVELVILLVKSYASQKALKENLELFQDNTILLTLQNGLGNIENINEVIDEGKIIAGVTSHGSTVIAPGIINHAGAGKTYIGELTGEHSSRVKKIAALFCNAGIETIVTDQIEILLWEKLMVNVGINSITAITGLKNGQILEYLETEELLEAAVKEALAVARANGIYITLDNPIEYVKNVCKATANNQSSMLQDVLHKRITEIQTINGVVVKAGKGAGIDTPINKVLTNLVVAIQNNYNNLER
ncbi:ketopantoate reductase family protein [Geosporobacter ferrireducens]|uniref:2-dehydropantoate 2-reductase n=1 Tax=Geosporobacter ferrireducens TaxID=1424294 RepID=A0A1D8GP00_9FIRM|nr:2-dehydropantoate 2-reductase [Geosporobacter ferrireducens]AOT72623.1 hypothetical protein Gferi_25550 [Geosporobacter ferrireducens]MTI55025.1 2-dehydropantoate 2-reductase [Geosporobacter ferrireducens]